MKLTSKVFHEDGSTPKLSRRKRKPLKRRVKKNIRKKMRWSKEAGDGHGSYSDCHYQLMFEITIWWKKNLTITMYYYVFYVLLSGMDLPFCFGGLRMTGFGTSFPDQFPPICISLIWMCYYIMYYNCIIYIYWLDSKHMNSYMVPHQLRGARRERASIYARATTGARMC